MPIQLSSDLPVEKVYICFYEDSGETHEAITSNEDWIKKHSLTYQLATEEQLFDYAQYGLHFPSSIIQTQDGYFKWFEYENCDPSDFEYLAVEPVIDGEVITSWELN